MCFVLLRWLLIICAFAMNRQGRDEERSHEQQLARIESAISAGTEFLVKQQSADGAWRSTTYGLLKDGTSLTPLVASALEDEGEGLAARERALRWMSTWFVYEGRRARLTSDVQYSVYAAGLCLPLLRRLDKVDDLAQIQAWTRLILELQLNNENGWSAEDLQYGGWGYSHEAPRRPEPGAILSPLDEPNLSATVFALEGLSDGNQLNRQAREAALAFVSRCQNLQTTDAPEDAKFNDGGFHFMQLDPVRNKPGIAGIDNRGETRFVSYGSATADGLRALLLCGVEPTDRRVIAAQKWLIEHFDEGTHPGDYPNDRASLKPSLDFYYANSIAHAFRSSPISSDQPLGEAKWAMRLSERLISLQKEDGSWTNPAVDVREDDPLIATPLALRALQVCRDELLSQYACQ